MFLPVKTSEKLFQGLPSSLVVSEAMVMLTALTVISNSVIIITFVADLIVDHSI